MAFLEKHSGREYDSIVYTTGLAEKHDDICRFVELVIAVEKFKMREVVAFTNDQRYRVAKAGADPKRWNTILLGKLGSGKIRAVVVDGQYEDNYCEVGIGVKTGHVCITIKKGQIFDFGAFAYSLGLIEDASEKEENEEDDDMWDE